MKQKMKMLKINEARPNLSKIVREVSTTKEPQVIGVREIPKVVVIDITTAKNHVPNFDIQDSERKIKETGGERFARVVREYAKKYHKKTNEKKGNVSENIDTILYGV